MKYMILICLAFCSHNLYSQTYDLNITVSGLKNTVGIIQIGIYNNKESFPRVDRQYKLCFIEPKELSVVCTIRDLPEGEYAVALFHDQNADGICNTNFLGIPREGYGFSKNFKPRLLVPDFNDCKIDLSSNMSITINPIYR